MVSIQVGDELVYNGYFHTIHSVNQEAKTVEIVRGNATETQPVTIGIQLATHLVNSRI